MKHSAVLGGATALTGVAVAAPAVYLAVLSLAAARRQRRRATTQGPRNGRASLRLAVLVPAHDEEVLLGRCLDTLAAQDYPQSLTRLVVIADNCSDCTADVARAHGAEVLERKNLDDRGKGPALRWAMEHLTRDEPGLEAFVVIDADSVADPGLLSALADAAHGGAQAVQADYEALVEGRNDRAQLRAAAFLLFHRVRFTGKAELGLPCSLVGNGMLFTTELIAAHPWTAFSEVEDLEYTLTLREAGIGPVFAPSGHLTAPVANSGLAAQVQRTRWEGGRIRLVRRRLPRILHSVGTARRFDLWDAAADFAVPPLGLLASGIIAGAAGSSLLRAGGFVGTGAVIPWALAGVALPVHVLVGLLAAEADPQVIAALRSAPLLVAAEVGNRVRALTGGSGPVEWVRTPRTAPGSVLHATTAPESAVE